MSAHLWWYIARASGLVSWALAGAAVAWGLALAGRVLPPRPSLAWLLDLHRFLGGLAVVFTAIHLGALVADSYAHFGLADLLVPLAASWHPVAVAWGVIALYLLLAIELTSLARRRLPRRVWRAVHRSSLPLFAFATVHGFAAGSEAGSPVFQWIALLAGVVVVFLAAYRALAPRRAARRRPARPGLPGIPQRDRVG